MSCFAGSSVLPVLSCGSHGQDNKLGELPANNYHLWLISGNRTDSLAFTMFGLQAIIHPR